MILLFFFFLVLVYINFDEGVCLDKKKDCLISPPCMKWWIPNCVAKFNFIFTDQSKKGEYQYDSLHIQSMGALLLAEVILLVI